MKLTPTILQEIQQLAHERYHHLQALRRTLHRYPELSGDESWTAAVLSEELKVLDLQVRTDIAGHGLIADLVTNPASGMLVHIDPVRAVKENKLA